MNRSLALLATLVLLLAASLWLWPRSETMAAPEVAGDVTDSRPAAPGLPSAEPIRPADPEVPRTSTSAPAVAATLPRSAAGEIAGLVVRPDGGPVRGALVTARTRATALAPVEVDQDGRFVCSALTPGAWYDVRAEAPGHVPAEVRSVAGCSVRIQLQPGVSLRGLVTNADRRPVAGARLLVEAPVGQHPGSSEQRTEIVASTQTDRWGRYQLAPVPLRDGRLLVLAAGTVPETRNLQALQPHEHELDIQLRRTLAVWCEVRDARDQRPIAGAEVFAGVQEALGQSDAGGRLQLRAPLDTPVVLRIQAAGYAPIEHHFKATAVDLERTTTFLLVRGGRVRGRVQDGAGNPIAGARLAVERQGLTPGRGADRARDARRALPALSSSSMFTGPSAESVASSGEDGRFELDGLLGKNGVLRARVRATCEGWCDATSEAFDLDPPVSEATVSITMVRGGTIEGRLTHGGAPTQGNVSATVGSHSVEAPTNDAGDFVLPRVPSGMAKVTGFIGHSAAPPTSIEVVVAEGGRARVVLDLPVGPPDQGLGELAGVVRDARGLPARGIEIQCRPDRQEGSHVSYGAMSDAAGAWRAQVPLGPDAESVTYTVWSRASGLSQRHHARVRPPRRDLDIVLTPTVAVRVEVTSADGKKLQAVRFWLRDAPGGPWMRFQRMDELRGIPPVDPVYSLQLPPGQFDLLVEAWSYLPAEVSGVRVTGPEDPPVRVVLQRGASLVLALTGDLEALEARTLYLVHAELAAGTTPTQEPLRNGVLQRGRVVRLDPAKDLLRGSTIRPGRYRLLAEDGDLAFDPEWFDVGEGDVTGRVRITLRK